MAKILVKVCLVLQLVMLSANINAEEMNIFVDDVSTLDHRNDCPCPSQCAQCANCAAMIPQLLTTSPYSTLYTFLTGDSNISRLTSELNFLLATSSLNAYNTLFLDAYGLAQAYAIANGLPVPPNPAGAPGARTTPGTASPRIVITESDGKVVIDTSKPWDEANPPADPTVQRNTLNNWNIAAPAGAGSVNWANHNTRVAIMDAQQYPCGLGAETKFSNTVGSNQAYVAVRLGNYLNNPGTVRISVNAL